MITAERIFRIRAQILDFQQVGVGPGVTGETANPVRSTSLLEGVLLGDGRADSVKVMLLSCRDGELWRRPPPLPE